MSKSASYILSAYSFLFSSSLEKLLDVGYRFKDGNPIPSFDEKLLIDLCSEAQTIFEKEDNILEMEGDLIIVGDIHGSFHDLLRIINYIQNKNKKVLFLGDYVDRGCFSLECVTILFALKVVHPDNYFLIRGNHEFDSLCSQYGFKDEILNYHNPKKALPSESTKKISFDVRAKSEGTEQADDYMNGYRDAGCYKYSESLYDAFIQVFSYLPIGAIVNNTTFCIHGGLSPKFEKIENLVTSITRPIKTFEDNPILCDAVWSDPSSNTESSYEENPRGRGCLFNANAVMFFLLKNSIKRIIRAHECVKKGSSSKFSGKCITVFSASSYDKNMNNCSAIIELFQKDDRLNFVTFAPLERLKKSDTLYYRVEPLEKSDGKIPYCFSYQLPKLDVNRTVKFQKTSNNFMKLQNSRSRVALLSMSSLGGTGAKKSSQAMLNSSLGDLTSITRGRKVFNLSDI